MKSAKFEYSVLAVILLLAAALRFYGLEIQSLWNDELSSWVASNQMTPKAILSQIIENDVHPPLSFIFLWEWMRCFGDSEFVLRLPSAVFGWLAVFFMWLLGRDLYGPREGLSAAGLTAVLYVPLFYSQEARHYSLLFLLSIVATHQWLRIINQYRSGESPRKAAFVIYALLITMAGYLHYFGLYLVVLQALGATVFLCRNAVAPRGLVYTYIYAFLAYLPWVPAMVKQFQGGPIWIKSPDPFWLFNYLEFTFNQSRAMMALGMVFLFIFFANFVRNRSWNNQLRMLSPDFVLVLWLVVPLVIIGIESIVSVPTLTYRNMIISLPAIVLMIIRGVYVLPIRKWGKDTMAAILCSIFLVHLFLGLKYYSMPHKEQFRESVRYIVDNNNRYPDSILIGFAWDPQYFNYYFRKAESPLRVALNLGNGVDTATLEKIVSHGNASYIWYISAHRVPDKQFVQYLTERTEIVNNVKFLGSEVKLLKINRAYDGSESN